MTLNTAADPQIELSPADKPNEAAVTLRIFGDSLNPNEITELLRCSPSMSHCKGELIKNRDGAPHWNAHIGRHSTRNTGMWSLKAPNSCPADIEGQMRNLLAQLPDDLEVWERISSFPDLKVEFFCGFFMCRTNEGIELSIQMLSEMAKRGIKLGLDIYSPDEHELREKREASPPI